jgi:hypothetical protein
LELAKVQFVSDASISVSAKNSTLNIPKLFLTTSPLPGLDFLVECSTQGSLTEREGSVSTVDLHAATSSDLHLFCIENIFYLFFTKQVTIIRRSTVLSTPLQLELHGPTTVLALNIDKFKEMLF